MILFITLTLTTPMAPKPPGGHQKGVDLWPWPEKTFRHRGCHHEGGVRWTVEEGSKLKVHQMHCWRQDLDHPHICKLMETYEKGSCLAMISQIFWGASDCSHAFNFHFLDGMMGDPKLVLGTSRESVDWLQLCCSGGSIYMMYVWFLSWRNGSCLFIGDSLGCELKRNVDFPLVRIHVFCHGVPEGQGPLYSQMLRVCFRCSAWRRWIHWEFFQVPLHSPCQQNGNSTATGWHRTGCSGAHDSHGGSQV